MTQVGFKSLGLVDEGVGDRLRFGLVELGRGFRREMRVFLESSSSGRALSLRMHLRVWIGILLIAMVHHLVHVGCFSLRLDVRDVGRVWFISIP